MRTIVFLAAFVLIASAAFCAEPDKDLYKAPYFSMMGTVGNNSGISMSCEGTAPYLEIDCTFTQMLIMTPSAAETKKKKKEALDEINKASKQDIEQARKDLLDVDWSKADKIMKTSTPAQKAFFDDTLAMFKSFKDLKDKQFYTKALNSIIDHEAATCKITMNTFNYHFTRVSKNKWLYNPGAEGACNVVRVATLENTPEYPELWVFTDTIASADQDEECKKWIDVGRTLVTRWDAPKAFKFEQCKYFEFGF